MKRIIFLLIFILSIPAVADVDVNEKPEPLPEKTFEFPQFEKIKLSNNANLIYIEDKEQPTIAIRILIPGGRSLDGEHPGLSEIVAELMTKGTKSYSAFEFAKTLDGIGASISASSNSDYISIYASSLKKHQDTLIKLLREALLHPRFEEDEFEKVVSIMESGIISEKGESSTLATYMTKMAVYGKKHPYAMRATEESIKEIELEDVKKYYEDYLVPNRASIAVIGDIKQKEAVELIETNFRDWKPGKLPKINVPDAKPMLRGVYFIHREGSAQSTVQISNVGVPANDQDYDGIDIAASYIGGGFASRLFKTLREEYSYTYSPYGYLTSSKYINRFTCGADVRSDVTDSSIMVIKKQLHDLVTSEPPADDLMRIKKYNVGSYVMNFENSSFIASLIQNSFFNGISTRNVINYPERILKMDPRYISMMARKYLDPENSFIVVVGDPSIRESLTQFGAIFDYDTDLNPLPEGGKLEKVSMDAEEVLEKYTEAIGGEDAIEDIENFSAEGSFDLRGGSMQYTGTYTWYAQNPNLSYRKIETDTYTMENWTDGEKAWKNSQGNIEELKEDNLKEELMNAQMFKETKLLDLGYKGKVMGAQNGMIQVKFTTPMGKQENHYFNQKTFLLEKITKIFEVAGRTFFSEEIYEDYKKFGEVMLPSKIISKNSRFFSVRILDYKLNVDLDESQFRPSEK